MIFNPGNSASSTLIGRTGPSKIATVASKGLKVRVACTAACTATGTMTAAKATARKLKRLKSTKATIKVTVEQNGATRSQSRALTLRR